MTIEINPIYQQFMESRHRNVFIKGSAGSGKSYVICQKILIRMLSEKTCNWMIVRKVASTLNDSVFKQMKSIITDMGLDKKFKITQNPLSITAINTKNYVVFKGVDDREKLKSITNIHNVFIEEATEIDWDDYLQILARVRSKPSDYTQIVCAFNPVSPMHWLKLKVWDEEATLNNSLLLTTTYKHNIYLDENAVIQYENMFSRDPVFAAAYLRGEWPIVSREGSMYFSFDHKNIKPLQYNKNNALHISLDFNVQPYATCLVFQVKDKDIYLIDDIVEEYPATTFGLIRKFCTKYKGHKEPLYVYGDMSGKQRKTNDDRTDYNIVESELKKDGFHYDMRVNNYNPSVKMTARFLNDIMTNTTYNFYVNDTCLRAINDLNNAKSDMNGDKLIEKERRDGLTYEKYHHMGDCCRYFIHKYLYEEYNNWCVRGKMIEPIYENKSDLYLYEEIYEGDPNPLMRWYKDAIIIKQE